VIKVFTTKIKLSGKAYIVKINVDNKGFYGINKE